jgi:hypothetical protein
VKTYLRNKAIALRCKGLSYSEIQLSVPVSRSTLSIWLRDIALSEDQINKLISKKLVGSKAGAVARHKYQVEDTGAIVSKAKDDIGPLDQSDLWLIGISLYWAEGAKQKQSNISQGVAFSNSDPNMLKVFITWVEKTLLIKKSDLAFEIYLHLTKSGDSEKVRNYWYNTLSIPKTIHLPIYFKKSISVSRKFNIDYHGLVRIKIRKSTKLNRKISGWIKGIYWGIV